MEIISSIIKYSLLGLILIPLMLIHQKVLYKEEKQVNWKVVFIVYIVMVAIFVLNDIFDFVDLPN
ncbi:hypothetical protein [Peloplasma aerotolerans]|uniref:Uncharacterized protein n=1 Tax=Peloplasma aerotolerans TaxID=3044389 RepID=A0AAW6U2I7_9MOLU|nr:hypothetical protein [Mariniplasma sp. M4Ah]MDI6452100.1 hypothetical protein [Mariniplasma sp. M4Ah]